MPSKPPRSAARFTIEGDWQWSIYEDLISKTFRVTCEREYTYVYGDGDFGILRCFRRCVQDQAIGVLDCPGEELQDHGRLLRFSGSYGGDDAFEVVETDCWDGISAFCGGLDDFPRRVVFKGASHFGRT